MKNRYLMSISGGRTSAMLSKLLIDKEKLTPYLHVCMSGGNLVQYWIYENETSEYIFVFANTSREEEATLMFLNDIEKHWGIKIVWVEALVNMKANKGTTHKVVNFNKAKRDGSIFEDVIKKYGIPNNAFIHCTRELKQQAIRSFMRSIGWGNWQQYKTIIGYRADEPKRANMVKAEKLNQWYPLYEWGIKKPDVAYFFNRQPFDLGIKVDAEGNCKKCYKKSDLKILYQVKSDPNDEWIQNMEIDYSTFTPDSRSNIKAPYYFFRDNRSLQDVIDQYPELKDKTADELMLLLNDKSLLEDGANYELLEQEDCAESCEAFTQEETPIG